MSLVGFTLLGSIEAPTLTGAATGVPLLVKPNTEFTAAMLLNLDVGGGDLRFSSDAAGLNQLPCEVVDGLDVVWVKPTAVSISTGATLYVWGDNTGASQPAVGAAFGRDAVWVDNDRRYHFEEDPSISDMVDSSGAQAGVRVGTFASGDKVAGAIGSALKFTLNTNYLTSGTVSTPANQPKTVSYITQFQTLTSQRGLFSIAGSATSGGPAVLLTMRSSSVDILDTGSYQDVFAPSTLTNYKIDYVYNGTTTTVYVDNVVEASYSSGSGFFASGVNLYINSGYSNQADQIISEFEYSDFAKSPDQISIEYDNQSTTGSWWVASDVAGGISINESVVNSNYVSLDPAILLTGSISVTESLVNTNYTALNPTVSFVGIISISESTVNTNYTALNPTIDFTGLVSVTESIVNSDYNSLSATITLTTGAVEIIESTAGTQYAVFNPSILLTPEPLGIVSTVCFNGELVDLNYSGQSGILEFSGQLETAIFNGEFNALDFSGTIQTTCADGDIKTNC
jgi:hypothetical protein